MARQRFAKPSFSNGCIGSIPILSAKMWPAGVVVAQVIPNHLVAVRFRSGTPSCMETTAPKIVLVVSCGSCIMVSVELLDRFKKY